MAGGTYEGLLRRGVTEGGEDQQCTAIGGLFSVAILESNGCTAIALDSRRAAAECVVVWRRTSFLQPFVRLPFSVSLTVGPLGTSTVWRAVPSCGAGRQVWSQTHTALHQASASLLCRPAAGPPVVLQESQGHPRTKSIPDCPRSCASMSGESL